MKIGSLAHRLDSVRPVLFASAVAFVLRLGWIERVPDVDLDAYGHFGVARTLLHDPWNLSAHWVWLPLYHYVLAALVALHGTFGMARILASLASAALPLVLYRAAAAEGDRRLAAVSAVGCAVAALPNLLGVSAQQEALFALLVLSGAACIDRRRFVAAGALVAAACLVRYEAWGAFGLLAAQALLSRLVPRWLPSAFRERLPLHLLAAPAVAILGFVLWHRAVDGRFLAFLAELYRYTHAQRGVLSHGALFDALYFPVLQPLLLFGPAVVLVAFGVRDACRPGWLLPLGIYLFLLASYAGKGSLGGARYYGSLAPFVCWAMAAGARRVAPRRRALAASLVLASLLATTGVAFVRLHAEADGARARLEQATARTRSQP